jgi:hypothetical protein
MTDIASPPPLQDHRFGEMIKGKHYAYARGLTINPIHLPVALDAMMEDGWELMAVFGDTKSDRVGFVFKRVRPAKPWCGTCGKDVQEILCEKCGGWWRDNDQMATALHDAINSPKGVVPQSAEPFYDPQHNERKGHD